MESCQSKSVHRPRKEKKDHTESLLAIPIHKWAPPPSSSISPPVLPSLLMQETKSPRLRQDNSSPCFPLHCMFLFCMIPMIYEMFMSQKAVVPKSDGGHYSVEGHSKSSGGGIKRWSLTELHQAKAKEMHLLEGSIFLHSSLSLCSNLFLQWSVSGRRPAAKKLQLPDVEIFCNSTGSADDEHEELCGREESVQGEVTDRWHHDEEVCGGGGSHDAAEEEESDGVCEEEECHEEEEEDRAESSQEDGHGWRRLILNLLFVLVFCH